MNQQVILSHPYVTYLLEYFLKSRIISLVFWGVLGHIQQYSGWAYSWQARSIWN